MDICLFLCYNDYMDLRVRNYIKKDEIIINCFDTWPNSLKSLMCENYELINNFRKREKELLSLEERYKHENNTYEIFSLINEFYNTFNELKEKFYNILLSENKPLICFHASRYTNKEKDRIRMYGLKTSSKDNLIDRIENLLKDGYIDEVESQFLKKHNLLIKQDNMRENQLWVTVGNVNIAYCSYSGLFNFYDNYGGEIQYFCIENHSLGEKLKKLSKPYLVVLKLCPTQIVECGLRILVDNIFNRINFENSEQVEYEFFTTEPNVLIEDIIEIDQNSKIII